MPNPWLLIGTLAFCISLLVSLILTRDWGASLVAATTAVGVAYLTTAIVNLYHHQSATSRIALLKQQLQSLRRQKTEVHQTIAELMAEQERVAAALATTQEHLRYQQVSGRAVPPFPAQGSAALSWDLSVSADAAVPGAAAIPPYATGDRLAPDRAATLELSPDPLHATATKQALTLALNQLQAELSHLNTQVKEQRQRRDHLHQDLSRLQEQQQTLRTTVDDLNQEIEQLQQVRDALDQAVVAAETHQHALAAETQPLQATVQALEAKVTALQIERQALEAEVTAKRDEQLQLDQHQQVQHAQIHDRQQLLATLDQQTADLEQELATLTAQYQALNPSAIAELAQQKATLEQELATLTQLASQHQQHFAQVQDRVHALEQHVRDRQQEKADLDAQIQQLQQEHPRGHLQSASAIAPATSSQPLETPPLTAPAAPVLQRPARPAPDPETNPAPPSDDDRDPALSDQWTEFMVQLPEYELQALKAIARDKQVFRSLNRIAEDNFTTAEELIASINQLAEALLGDRVIQVRGTAPPMICRPHQHTIKTLIKTYDYLTQG